MKNLISLKKSFKLALASVALLGMQAVPTHVFAADPAFDEGSNTIALGVGFGVNYYSNATVSPAFAFIYDHGFFPEVGPGTIGIGGIIGYKSASYDYGFGGYKQKWTNTIVGVRGTYHLTILADKNNKFDPYAGIMIGLRFNSYSNKGYDDWYYNNFGYHYNYTYNKSDLVSGAFIGAKYNFADAVGAFAELGYDISYAKIGINFNF